MLLMSGIGTAVDVPRGILYLYFASAANSTFAQMALGYRHAYGLGVPKSCQAAVLYYAVPAQVRY
jgi:SEL1 protein